MTRFIGLLALSFSLSCLAAPAPATVKKGTSKKMQELSKVLEGILPDIISPKPGTSKALEKNVKRLSELAHHIKPDPKAKPGALTADGDPSLVIFSDLFQRETQRAYLALKNGSPEYAKMILRTTTTYCISCHTRTDSGPQFPLVNLPKAAEKLTPFEKAQWLAATRQFEPALNEFTKVLSDTTLASKRQIEWQRAVKQALAISVRMKRDPERSLTLVDTSLQTAGVPAFFKEQLNAWKASILAWKAEKPQNLKTEEELYRELTRLVEVAKSQQGYPADHSADVVYLRASGVGHDLLALNVTGSHAAEAMLWIGSAYEVLDDPILWPLHEMYFEGCIRHAPKTATARDCFAKYEAAVYFGYSGSGGVNVPADAQKLLAELKGLAGEVENPEASPTPPPANP